MLPQLKLLTIYLLCAVAYAQQTPGLTQFLSLTPAQVASITQLNLVYNQLVQSKTARENQVQSEIAVESAKSSPSALALGQRYIEIDSIQHEITVAVTDLQLKVTALLTPAQMALVQQIASASILQSLNADASCGYLAPAFPTPPTFLQRSGDFSVLTGLPAANSTVPGIVLTSFLIGPSPFCAATYPISIRNYLSLTDAQVSAILALENAYATLQTRKANRTNDVNIEIRDETAKPAPDPLALGVRYSELIEISQELKQADLDGRAAARNLLTPAQQAKLKSLMDNATLSNYLFAASGCHFLTLPNIGFQFPCQLN